MSSSAWTGLYMISLSSVVRRGGLAFCRFQNLRGTLSLAKEKVRGDGRVLMTRGSLVIIMVINIIQGHNNIFHNIYEMQSRNDI